KSLQAAEKAENNCLVEILGAVKPARSSKSTITSIVRGLYTKNAKLLTILDADIKEVIDNPEFELDTYKGFVNSFILWLDADAMVLFDKYAAFITSKDSYHNFTNLDKVESFAGPLTNCVHYLDFIAATSNLLRNPFVIDKLSTIKEFMERLLNNYRELLESSRLNDIGFANINAFVTPTTPTVTHKPPSRGPPKVSGIFKLEQIVERTKDEPLLLHDKDHKEVPIELVLLDIGGSRGSHGKKYNSLAILQVHSGTKEFSRSLMFPPFRVNEVSVDFKRDTLFLKAINFSHPENTDSVISITGLDSQFLYDWHKKLTAIFPEEAKHSPVGEDSFLITPVNSPTKMAGLGINVLSDSEHKQDIKDREEQQKYHTPQKPKLYIQETSEQSSSPLSQLEKHFRNSIQKSNGTNEIPILPPPPPAFQLRKPSSTSIQSEDSSDSAKTQYDRSLSIIEKTVSSTTLARLVSTKADGDTCPTKVINKRTMESSLDCDAGGRPISSQGEIVDVEGTPVMIKAPTLPNIVTETGRLSLSDKHHSGQQTKFSSVPDLATGRSSNLYQLSTGSEIDISNFGKDYRPSFAESEVSINSKKGSSPSVGSGTPGTQKKPTRKKSLFNLFKKGSKANLNDNSVDSVSTNTNLANKSMDSTSTDQSFNSFSSSILNKKDSDDSVTSSISTNDLMKKDSDATLNSSTKNTIPTAFALPSSTSTYFFKQYKNGSSASLGQHNDSQTNLELLESTEEELFVSDEIKSMINDDHSIEFFITEATPKAMKVSKWKPKYGKWEMITVNENLFARIVTNYHLNKSWIIFFKQDTDANNAEIDKPILLLDIVGGQTSVKLNALDLQISSINSVTSEKMQIMVRCKTSALGNSILTNVNNVMGVLSANAKNNNYGSLQNSELAPSSFTITSSIMDGKCQPSASTTYSSFSSSESRSTTKSAKPISRMKKGGSDYSINSQEAANLNILTNPDNTKLILLNQMPVRLQKQLESYNSISTPSSWKILSMYSLTVYSITESFTNKSYFNLVLKKTDIESKAETEFNWLIRDAEMYKRIERIGKAGLLVKVTNDDIFMIECKGRKELHQLIGIF
ncbi:predicted protein, partial [Scheffersomyces stipitis CBS 6054]